MAPTTQGGAFMLDGPRPAFTTPEAFDEEQRALQRMAADFTCGELLPVVARLEAQEPGLMRALLRKAGALGLLAGDIPEEYGGLGLPKTTTLLLQEAMVHYGSWGVTLGAHTTIGTLPIRFFGTPAQKAHYLPRLASAERVAAYALTEAGSGSDALAARTTARRDGEHWVLDGTKQWITNAGFADVFTVFAKVDGAAFTAFIVERGDPGVRVGPEEKKLGIRGSSTCDLVLDGAQLPADRLLGEVGRGHRIAFGILNMGRLKLGSGAAGSCKYALGLAVEFARTRRQFGRAIAEFGMVREKLAAMAVRTFLVESMAYRTSGLIDAFLHAGDGSVGHEQRALEEYAVECSILKVAGSEAAAWVADEALQVHGGYGFTAHFPIERVYRDVRINRIFEGTNEINRLIIPGTLLKRAARGGPAWLTPPDAPPPPAPAGPLGQEERFLVVARRLVARLCAHASTTLGEALDERQDVQHRMADLLMDVFAVDTVLGRAHQTREHLGPEAARLQQALSAWATYDASERIRGNARRLAAALASGPALDALLDQTRALEVRPPDLLHARETITERLLADGAYRQP
ncbi:MAG: acyl-CoA dehydrogenase family protein [Deltaproteobacteria bacterium]|nr:acyl-CoA dehydrogenase family protein [Deltaproteobacteria bacterium]